MNRKTYSIFALALIFLAAGFLTSCSSSSSAPTIAITATGGTTQTQTITEAFPTALGVNVTSNGSPATGVTVTFAPPSSGASCTPSGTTATTDSNGNASITCTANSTAGAYSVTATATGASAPASFSLTNAPPSVFTFYVSGAEEINDGPNYYAVAGAVAFDMSGATFPDANGNCGEQDYNDGIGLTSVAGGDTIAAATSSLTVDQTSGTGTLVLDVSALDPNVGAAGIETFAVQFMNASHAIITQFDGSATSSGSMDLQSATTDSNFAFTISGVDSNYEGVGYGGVFSIGTGGALTGTADVNDDGTATVGPAANLSGSVTAQADAYGRGTATVVINTTTLSLVYYNVTAEAMRLIDMDAGGTAGAGSAAVGSAFGQGATPAFDSTALGTADVFGVQAGQWGWIPYAETGSLVTSGAAAGTAGATFSSGEADNDWEGEIVADTPVEATSSYTIAANGYGSATINETGVSPLPFGVYATLSSVNLVDPNNTSGGGGALLLDVYQGDLSGGTGVIVPQGTIASDGSDLNNSYGFGTQQIFAAAGGEFDYVAQGTIATLALTGAGDVSDPFNYFAQTAAGVYTAIPVAGTAAAPDAAGRFAFPAAPFPTPLDPTDFAIGPVGTNTAANPFSIAMYEATGALVFSIDEDSESLSLGTFQAQSTSSLKAAHFKRGAVPKSKSQAKRKH
jgi:hypothetical protein